MIQKPLLWRWVEVGKSACVLVGICELRLSLPARYDPQCPSLLDFLSGCLVRPMDCNWGTGAYSLMLHLYYIHTYSTLVGPFAFVYLLVALLLFLFRSTNRRRGCGGRLEERGVPIKGTAHPHTQRAPGQSYSVPAVCVVICFLSGLGFHIRLDSVLKRACAFPVSLFLPGCRARALVLPSRRPRWPGARGAPRAPR
jgi:hypothetical protein